MSDAIASQSALDPDRPWITDANQLPSKMNWLDTFFNPTGKTPTLHFTRAWTVLFMAQVVAFFSEGGTATPHEKSPLLRTPEFTAEEQQDLVAFLESLTNEPPSVETGRLPP